MCIKSTYFLKIYLLVTLMCFGFEQNIYAQLNISFPFEGAVFQRSTSNVANLNIAGSYTGSVDKIEARLTSVSGGNNIGWTTIHTNPSGGNYTGSLSGVTGGW